MGESVATLGGTHNTARSHRPVAHTCVFVQAVMGAGSADFSVACGCRNMGGATSVLRDKCPRPLFHSRHAALDTESTAPTRSAVKLGGSSAHRQHAIDDGRCGVYTCPAPAHESRYGSMHYTKFMHKSATTDAHLGTMNLVPNLVIDWALLGADRRNNLQIRKSVPACRRSGAILLKRP